ncbi:heat shock protein 27-like [Culicoides brevitarsis]|uniref:heat shock protein 27-like n=1 Tax=Culicoides brevitarsis TaxID=469753 RepID=UPI00307B6E29
MDRSVLIPFFYDDEPTEWSLFDPWRYALQSFGHHHPAHRHGSNKKNDLFSQYLRELQKDFETVQKLDDEGFRFRVDVQDYKPEEIKVTLHDNTVTVEGKHEERSDAHGTISRQFVRKFALPKGVIDVEKLQSNFSSDGVLTICAPKLPSIENKKREIPIERVGPVKEQLKNKEEAKNGAANGKNGEKMETK